MHENTNAHSRLLTVSTATITTVLLKRGLRNVWIRGAAPLRRGVRRVGYAFTLRYVAAREDLATPAAWNAPNSTRAAVEAMPENVLVVVDAAGGLKDAGIVGDILCTRMAARNVAALVSDGVVRDVTGIEGSGLAVWCAGVAPTPSVAGLTFVGWQEPISCGGVAVFPGDTIVADDDGAIVVPAALLDSLIDECCEVEAFEAWVVQEVRDGRGLLGLYPPDAETLARYHAQSSKDE